MVAEAIKRKLADVRRTSRLVSDRNGLAILAIRELLLLAALRVLAERGA